MDGAEPTKKEIKHFYLRRRQLGSLFWKDRSAFSKWVNIDSRARHHDIIYGVYAISFGCVFMLISGLIFGEYQLAIVYIPGIILPWVWIYMREELRGYRTLMGYARVVDRDMDELSGVLSSILTEEGITYHVHGLPFSRSKKRSTRRRMDLSDERNLGYMMAIDDTPIVINSWEAILEDPDRSGTLVHVSIDGVGYRDQVDKVMRMVDRGATC